MKRQFPMITADDWGMSPAINEGILEIARCGGIGRISVMPLEPHSAYLLSELKEIPDLSFGLHFNLIHQQYTSPFALLRAWLFSGVQKKNSLIYWVRSELQNQLAQMQKLGIKPIYFDGHQHIHLIPGLMNEIADILMAHQIKSIRVPLDWRLAVSKKFVIPFFALNLKREIKKWDFSVQEFFYPREKEFLQPEKLKVLFEKNSQKEILVHPAKPSAEASSVIKSGFEMRRLKEFAALKILFAQ